MDISKDRPPVIRKIFHGRLAILQRVLPSYRVPFFEMLAGQCAGGLVLAAGKPRWTEAIDNVVDLDVASFTNINNIHILGGPYYLCWQTGLIQWLDDTNPDALIVEANPRYLSTRNALNWMKVHSKPVIGWGLGAPHPYRKGLNPRDFFRMIFLRQFDALVSYSQRGADEYRSLGFPSERIFVAHNAVAPHPANPPIVRPLPKKSQTCLLFVGRLQKRKRLDLLIKACSSLSPDLHPRLVIVGDGPEQAALKNLAGSLFPSTEFKGALFGDQLEYYFRAADLFVLPGTGGLAVQQAMGWSLPIIAARGDGTQEDLVRPGNGWQIPSDDLPALVNTLKQALLDLPRLRKMGLESYRIVSEEINLEKMVSVFISSLNQIISE